MTSVVALAVTVRLKDRPHSVRRKFGGRKQVGDKREGERDDCAITQAKKSSGDDELIDAVQRDRQNPCRAAQQHGDDKIAAPCR